MTRATPAGLEPARIAPQAIDLLAFLPPRDGGFQFGFQEEG